RTPLHLAVQGEQASAVEMLMNHIKEVDPALLNLGDFDGNSPLHLACDTHNAAIVSLLLKGTADVNVRNTIGMTAYNLATERGFEDIADTLIQHGADRSPQQFPTLKGPYFGETPPELTPKLFAKGIVSTSSGRHSSIDFSPNLDEAVWQSGDTLCFMKMENGVWRAPREVPFFKPGYSVDAPFFSADGSRVYLLAGPLDASGISGRLFVWYMDRTRDGWSDPRLLDSVASSVPIHWQASMDKDGNLYTGAGSIYCSRFVNGKYLTPEKLPDIINVVPESAELAGEIGPFISRNGDYLIFNRFNPRPSFEVSFLVSFRRSDGSWSEPQNLSEKLGGGGMAARVTPDGKYLFFMSDRPGSARERSIYWVDAKVIEELRPRE
ncbi:MAG: ankyrin repeat domain-containing protein, partial [candidate division Zixibacteria bacterium]|nr:ankyrin repeat domain-containing protein [candidate division Zixibacteria bacterium]